MNQPLTDFRRVEAEQLQNFLEICLKACNLAVDHAQIIAELLTQAAGAVRHIGHYGSASHYTRMCAEAGCVGFSVQGVASGYVFPNLPIALWGSRPLSFAIPAGDRPPSS